MARKAFKVATFNANSIRSRLPIVLDWLEAQAPDILCLQETKVQDEHFPADAFAGAGYRIIFRGQKAYSGVALASKEEPEDVFFGLDDGGEPDEARLVCAVYRGIPVVNTYVPQGTATDSPNFQYKLEWFRRLHSFFERHYTPKKPLLWCGDLNVAPDPIDVHDPKRLLGHVCFHPEVHKALRDVMAWGFVDVFRKHCPGPEQYTFWDYRVRDAVERGLGWRVDHVMATRPLAERSITAYIDIEARLRPKPSDHTFVVAEFRIT